MVAVTRATMAEAEAVATAVSTALHEQEADVSCFWL